MKGFSLPIVLFTLALGGALSVGGAFVTRQMASSARSLSRWAEVEALAEEVAVGKLLKWETGADSVPTGATLRLEGRHSAAARADAWITRTAETTYWLVVEATSRSKPLLRKRLGVTVVAGSEGGRLVHSRAWSDLP